ncbi:MAG: mechanosensitive ion channel [Pseudomonadales bacterium]
MLTHQRRWLRGMATGMAMTVAGHGLCADALLPDLGEIHSRIGAIETSGAIDESARQRTLQLYRNAVASLEAWERDTAGARAFARAPEGAPNATARWERESARLSALPSAPPSTPAGDIDASSRELAAEQARLSELQAELESVKEAAGAETDLDLPAALAEVQMALAQPQNRLDADYGSAEVSEAFDIAAAARQRALRAKADMLQQRLLSRDARLAQMAAHRRYLTLAIDLLTKRVDHLQSHVNELRQRVAGRAARSAEALVTRLDEQPQWVRDMAAENADLAAQIADVTEKTEVLTKARNALAEQQAQIARYHENLTQQLAVTGAEQSAELGRAMVRQRKRLNELRSAPDYQELEQQITSARLLQLKLEDQQLSESTLARPEWENKVAIDRSLELASNLREKRLKLLDEGVAAYRRYITEMTRIRSDASALGTATDSYEGLLNRRLFWIPSSAGIGIESWSTLSDEFGWIGAQAGQIEPAAGLDQLRRSPGVALLVLCSAGLLLAFRRRLWQPVARLSSVSDSVHGPAMGATWKGMGRALAAAAPAPLLLYGFGIALESGSGFGLTVGTGFQQAALIWYLLAAFANLCRPDGIAQRHFKWSQRILDALRSNLPFLSAVLVTTTLLLCVAEASADAVGSDGFGRLIFAFSLLAVAFSAHNIAQARLDANAIAASESRVLRVLARMLAVLIPLSLLVLSVAGYHFTAQQLAQRGLITVGIVAIGVLAFYVAVCAISVVERRLALSKFRTRLDQDSALSEADSASQDSPATVDLQEIDVDAVGLQTRSVVKMAIGAVTAMVVWGLWSDMLPALSVIQDMTLWHSGPDHEAITLAHGMLAVLIAFLTYFGYRNLPGALEVSVLARLELEPGSSFAIMTISKYLIVFTGTFSVISLLGAQWSQLQWLVAALGVGLGFGLQEVVANFVSGFLILFERPIRVGDTVTIGGHTGTVSRIRIRSTTIIDHDRREHIIPNRAIINDQLTNWTLRDSITRLVLKICVAHGSDTAVVQQALLDVARSNPRVIAEPPPSVLFMGFGETGLDFEVRAFTKTVMDRVPLTHELHSAIEREFKARGIEVPSPLRDLERLSSVQTTLARRDPIKAGPAGSTTGSMPIIKERNL